MISVFNKFVLACVFFVIYYTNTLVLPHSLDGYAKTFFSERGYFSLYISLFFLAVTLLLLILHTVAPKQQKSGHPPSVTTYVKAIDVTTSAIGLAVLVCMMDFSTMT